MVKRTTDLPGDTASGWDEQKAVEKQLVASLRSLTKQVKRITQQSQSAEEITAAISALSNSEQWKKLAVAEAVKMVRGIAVKNARTWREAARQGQRSHQIYQSLKAEIFNNRRFVELVQRNASYIKALPDDVSRHITRHVSTQALRGERADTLVEHLRSKAPELSEARINLIARTETAKTQAAVTQIRAEQVGVQYYVWQTAEDSRVRSSHRHMQGVICDYRNPPSPEKLRGETSVGNYGPGEIWNCRCFAAPLIDPEFEKWPKRVVHGGQIVKMSRKQFEAI